jgi:hypothetical protein
MNSVVINPTTFAAQFKRRELFIGRRRPRRHHAKHANICDACIYAMHQACDRPESCSCIHHDLLREELSKLGLSVPSPL